ncbi:hypothetical protein HMPREF9412_4123 [Paenibacillus sp. HGF5]|nr:hypothetical protein HMPREF9412_4123 [Paenibacillus sp. HGF5]
MSSQAEPKKRKALTNALAQAGYGIDPLGAANHDLVHPV